MDEKSLRALLDSLPDDWDEPDVGALELKLKKANERLESLPGEDEIYKIIEDSSLSNLHLARKIAKRIGK